jgi:hypothetical protein
VQFLRGFYLSHLAGQKCVWYLFLIRRLHGFGHHCELSVHGGDKGRSLDDIERMFGVKWEKGDTVMARIGRAMTRLRSSENKMA